MGLLRFFLAIIVILGHSPPTFFNKPLNADGGLAVQSFYVISGFYMALIIHKYHLREFNFSYLKSFYANRALRIFPIYWMCLGTSFFLAYINWVDFTWWPHEAMSLLHNWFDKIFYILSNLFILGIDVMRFSIYDPSTHSFIWTLTGTSNVVVEQHLTQLGSEFSIMGQAWTLSLELLFYFLVPFILTRNIRFVITICLISLTLKYYLFASELSYKNYNLQVAFFPSELSLFLLGSLSQFLIYPWLKRKSFLFIKRTAQLWTCIFTLYIFVIFPRLGSYDLKSFLFVGFIIFAIPFLFTYYKNSRFDRWLGDLSYPMYMNHLICLGILKHFKLDTSLFTGYYAIAFAFLLSIFFLYAIIIPVDHLRSLNLNRKRSASLAFHKEPGLNKSSSYF